MVRRAWPLFVLTALLAGIAAAAAAGGPSGEEPDLRRAIAAQERHTEALLARDGVVGTAATVADGRAAVVVLAAREGVVGIPRALDGFDVVVRVTGPIRALHHRPGHSGGPGGGGGDGDSLDPKTRFQRPVPIGVSTGVEHECSAGTIGARVKSGSRIYALSNNHVYAQENQAPIGSRVLQPGRYDTGCAFDPANVIGSLSTFVPIVFTTSASNRVDAAIAETTTADLGNSTPSDGYGTPKSATVNAAVGQPVMKYGRTTSLTQGTITMVNATVNVGYGSGTARFVDQVIVEANGAFIRSGDSGSLLVTSAKNPVGLLFAGNQSGRLAVANRIQDVVSALGVSVDGT